MDNLVPFLAEVLPEILGALAAAALLAILARFRNFGGTQRFFQQIRRVLFGYPRIPSTTEDLKRRIAKTIREVRALDDDDEAQLRHLIVGNLGRREQALRPIEDTLLGTLTTARRTKANGIRYQILSDLERLSNEIDESSRRLGSLGAALLSESAQGLVRTLILADFSVPIQNILRELADRFPTRRNAVKVYIISSGRRFLSSQDTQRWRRELTSNNLQRFYYGREVIRLREVTSFLTKYEKNGTVLLAGVERIYPDGKVVVFPGIRSLVTAASARDVDVLFVGQTFKVHQVLDGETVGIGSDIYGATVELGLVELSARVALLTDHGYHGQFSRDRFAYRRPKTRNLNCCLRYHGNRIEGRAYPIGVVFDLDGTLLASEAHHMKLYQKIGQRIGYPFTDEEYEASLQGMTDEDTLAEIARRAEWKGDLKVLVREKQGEYLYLLRKGEVHGTTGAGEYLGRLREQGFLLGIATSATPREAAAAIKLFGLGSGDLAVVTCADVTRGKPDPTVYLTVVERLGLLPKECLVYEDSLQGVRSARAAGCHVVGIGRRTAKEKMDAGAMLIIDNFEAHQLPECGGTSSQV